MIVNVQLHVIKGPDMGKIFNFSGYNGGEYFIVGRTGDGTKAHYRLSDKDMCVSRNHCIFEIRPPRCFIKDLESLNGTRIKRKEEKVFELINSFVELSDGDIIEIGDTILKINIIKQAEFKDKEENVQDKQREEHFLKRVANWINIVKNKEEEKGEGKINDKDEKKYNVDLRKPPTSYDAIKNNKNNLIKKYNGKNCLICMRCSKDVSNYLNNKVRAHHLSDNTLYICPNCVMMTYKKGADVGEYKILEKLGEGGMGIVYKAWHKSSCRIVALKRIKNEFSGNLYSLKSFKREMAIHQQLYHKNIVQLLDGVYDERKGQYYFVSEFMPDGDVENLMENEYHGPLPVYDACDIAIQILKGLEYIHGKGKDIINYDSSDHLSKNDLEKIKDSFVHRDIKPANILISFNKKGRKLITSKLGDFGIAKPWEEAGNSTLSLTAQYGQAKGTILYMPIEQMIDSAYVKPSVDVYAVGITLYYLLTAKYPLDFPSRFEKEQNISKDYIRMILEDERIPILKKNSTIPPGLAEIVDNTIRKDEKNRRYKTARELRNAIEGYLN